VKNHLWICRVKTTRTGDTRGHNELTHAANSSPGLSASFRQPGWSSTRRGEHSRRSQVVVDGARREAQVQCGWNTVLGVRVIIGLFRGLKAQLDILHGNERERTGHRELTAARIRHHVDFDSGQVGRDKFPRCGVLVVSQGLQPAASWYVSWLVRCR